MITLVTSYWHMELIANLPCDFNLSFTWGGDFALKKRDEMKFAAVN